MPITAPPPSITPPPGLHSFAYSDAEMETSDNYADVSATPSSDGEACINDDISPELSPSQCTVNHNIVAGKDKQVAEQTLAPLLAAAHEQHRQQIASRKLNKHRQQRTPGCAKAKKGHAQTHQHQPQLQVSEKSVRTAAAIHTSKSTKTKRAGSKSSEFCQQRWLSLLCLVGLVLVGMIAFPMCYHLRASDASSASATTVAPGSSYASATVVPGDSLVGDQRCAPIVKTMDVEIARGNAVASHVTAKIKAIQASLKKI
jgi:hypothetical protein